MRLAILAIVQPKALKTNTSKRTAELPWAELGVCGGKRGEAAPPEFQHTLSNSCCKVAPDASFPNPSIVDWQCKQVLDTYLARRYQAARKLNKRRNLKDVHDISAFTTRRTTHYYLPFCTTRNEGNERIIAKQELRQTAEHTGREITKERSTADYASDAQICRCCCREHGAAASREYRRSLESSLCCAARFGVPYKVCVSTYS